MTSGSFHIRDIVEKRICCGCGGCVAACPQEGIRMVEGVHFNYPYIEEESCERCDLCTAVCPSSDLLSGTVPSRVDPGLKDEYEYLLVHATDPDLRRNAASGGFVTSLLIGLLQEGHIDGAVVVRQDQNDPLVNRPFLARSENEILSSCGSRYGPASNCSVLGRMMRIPGRYAFVGKGCDISALRKLQSRFSWVQERIVLTIGLFCAQTPSRNNTLSFLMKHGLHKDQVRTIRYRGNGWPGSFRAHNETKVLLDTPYLETWNSLVEGHDSIRCLLCFDPFALEADISVGDPWREDLMRHEKDGLSLVIARNKLAQDAIGTVKEKGNLSTSKSSVSEVVRCQKSLMEKLEKAREKVLMYRLLFLGEWKDILTLTRSRFPIARTLLRQKRTKDYY